MISWLDWGARLGCFGLRTLDLDHLWAGLCYSDARWLLGIFVWASLAGLLYAFYHFGAEGAS